MTPEQATRRREEIQAMAALRGELDRAIANGNTELDNARKRFEGQCKDWSDETFASIQGGLRRSYMNAAWFAGERAYEFLTLLCTVDEPASGKVKERLTALQRQITTVQTGPSEVERKEARKAKDKRGEAA